MQHCPAAPPSDVQYPLACRPTPASLPFSISSKPLSPQAKATPANWGTGDKVFNEPMKDHTNALQLVSKFLSDTFAHSFTDEVHSVGHRVVHGREFSDAALIT